MARTLTISGSVGNPVFVSSDADWQGLTISSNYYPTTTDGMANSWTGEWMYVSSNVHHDIHIKEEEVKDMRGLFHVVVVEYKTDKILKDGLVIAKDKETAKIKMLAPLADKYDLDDLDIICNRLGDVRKKQEVQKVEIVK